jgi:hypothetical protein
LNEAGGIDFVSLQDPNGVIHHLTSRSLTIEKAEADMFGLVNTLITECKWTVHNDVRETLPYGNKTRELPNTNEPTRVPCDDSGNELTPDSAGRIPGMKGWYHITKAKFGMVKDGKVEYTLNGPYLGGEELAKYPYWDRKNAKVDMLVHWFKPVIPEIMEGWFNSARVPEMDVDWIVEYEVANARPKYKDQTTGEEKIGKYYLNITSVKFRTAPE